MNEIEIKLEDVRMFAHHGVYDFERRDGNDFEVNLAVRYPAPEDEVLAEDNLFNTLSYVSLFEIVKEEMEKPRNLLETVAASIVNRIRKDFTFITYAECTISKLKAPIPGFVGKASVKYSGRLDKS